MVARLRHCSGFESCSLLYITRREILRKGETERKRKEEDTQRGVD